MPTRVRCSRVTEAIRDYQVGHDELHKHMYLKARVQDGVITDITCKELGIVKRFFRRIFGNLFFKNYNIHYITKKLNEADENHEAFNELDSSEETQASFRYLEHNCWEHSQTHEGRRDHIALIFARHFGQSWVQTPNTTSTSEGEERPASTTPGSSEIPPPPPPPPSTPPSTEAAPPLPMRDHGPQPGMTIEQRQAAAASRDLARRLRLEEGAFDAITLRTVAGANMIEARTFLQENLLRGFSEEQLQFIVDLADGNETTEPFDMHGSTESWQALLQEFPICKEAARLQISALRSAGSDEAQRQAAIGGMRVGSEQLQQVQLRPADDRQIASSSTAPKSTPVVAAIQDFSRKAERLVLRGAETVIGPSAHKQQDHLRLAWAGYLSGLPLQFYKDLAEITGLVIEGSGEEMASRAKAFEEINEGRISEAMRPHIQLWYDAIVKDQNIASPQYRAFQAGLDDALKERTNELARAQIQDRYNRVLDPQDKQVLPVLGLLASLQDKGSEVLPVLMQGSREQLEAMRGGDNEDLATDAANALEVMNAIDGMLQEREAAGDIFAQIQAGRIESTDDEAKEALREQHQLISGLSGENQEELEAELAALPDSPHKAAAERFLNEAEWSRGRALSEVARQMREGPNSPPVA